ncbi:MAG: GAF domain-containing sensor histidine kinase [Phenylobacterium sp.]
MATIADDVAAVGRIDVAATILEVVCRTTGMGFAAIARVTEDRWVACAVRDEIAFGLVPGSELELQTTICNEIRQSGQAVVIDEVATDEAFSAHHTPAMYGFQSYISVPIQRNGAFFGTLCAIDPRPAQLNNPATIGMFNLFADLIAQHLNKDQLLAESEAALLSAREGAELREQFIAVLGHDLRNPLASIQAGCRLIGRTELDDRAVSLVALMLSSVDRMAGLIDDVLDFARARLGGGFEVGLKPDPSLAAALEMAVEEMRLAHPDREITADIALDVPVSCDTSRVVQLFSNLLGNALTHGSDTEPVRVRGRTEDGRFSLSVANAGQRIDPQTLERLFQPFSRASSHPHQKGLGLGLYICAEIARAHGGDLTVISTDEETQFTFAMPLA